MAIVEGWLPPTRENWGLLLTFWQFAYPVVRKHCSTFSLPSHPIRPTSLCHELHDSQNIADMCLHIILS